MAKIKKFSLSKIIKETEDEYDKAKKESVKRAYRDLLSLLENVHSANLVAEGSRTVHIFSSIARSADKIHDILQTINGYKSDNPRLWFKANHDNGGSLHYDVIIYRPKTNFAATAVNFKVPEDHLLTPEVLDNEYNALLNELRKLAK